MALTFSGSGQYLTQTAIATGAPFSFACWYNPGDVSSNRGLFSVGNTSTNNFMGMYLQPTHLAAQSTASGTSNSSVSVAALTVGTWFHCVSVFASITSRITYLNGIASTVNSTSISPTGLNVYSLGVLFNGAPVDLALGSIAYPAAWNVALTPTDVANLYNSGSGVNPSTIEAANLLSFSVLQTGPPYRDIITSNNWTITGSPTISADPFTITVPSTSVFPGAADTFKTIPTPSLTATNVSDASDDTLSTRLQQHSDAIFAVENWLLNNTLSEPSGVVKAFAGSTAPAGYLLCNGQAVSRTTFATLFGVISTTFGTGNGSTTFNVPNLSGSVPVGTGTAPTGTTNRTLAASGGEESHTLITAELAVHNHVQNAHTHTDTGHTHTDSGHTHGDTGHVHSDSGHGHTDSGHLHTYFSPTTATAGSGSNVFASNGLGGAFTGSGNAVISTGFAAIGTGFAVLATNFANIQAAAANITTVTAINNAAGSGSSHNTMPPFCVLNWIVKY